MSKEINDKMSKLLEEQSTYSDAYLEYLRIENELASLKQECKHENAYINGSNKDTYEGRSYDEIICPDCLKEWEERCYCGKHNYLTKVEHEAKLNNQAPKGCNGCEFLDFIPSKNYLGEILYGGATYTCKKGYFLLLPYPSQPQECIDGIPPKNIFDDIPIHQVTDEEMNEIHRSCEISKNIKQPKYNK